MPVEGVRFAAELRTAAGNCRGGRACGAGDDSDTSCSLDKFWRLLFALPSAPSVLFFLLFWEGDSL